MGAVIIVSILAIVMVLVVVFIPKGDKPETAESKTTIDGQEEGKPMTSINSPETTMQADIRTIKHWITFFGIITIIGIVVGIIVVLS